MVYYVRSVSRLRRGAFAVVIVLIYVLVLGWFRSYVVH